MAVSLTKEIELNCLVPDTPPGNPTEQSALASKRELGGRAFVGITGCGFYPVAREEALCSH